jgi:beta-lactamase superfamily II metal-dependent hydrolase
MKIENSVLCSEEFKEAARWATAEICEGLTLSNLREIRNLILSHTDDDDTEEDED